MHPEVLPDMAKATRRHHRRSAFMGQSARGLVQARAPSQRTQRRHAKRGTHGYSRRPLAARAELYTKARKRHSARWARQACDWHLATDVLVNLNDAEEDRSITNDATITLTHD
jgi:hypothetical protein